MTRLMKNAIGVFAIVLSTVAAAPADAADAYKVSSGEVTVMCPLTVGGSFEAKTKNLSGDVTPASDEQGAVRGALKVELQTLETGIGIRDRHMKSNYLEVEKGPGFSTATIDDIRVEKLEGKTVFTGDAEPARPEEKGDRRGGAAAEGRQDPRPGAVPGEGVGVRDSGADVSRRRREATKSRSRCR